jgi:hypothetical protein
MSLSPESTWNTVERDAWNEVLAMADSTPPLSFTQIEPLVAHGRDTVLAVARRFHPDASSAWSRFSLPEALLLAERLARDFRREALHHIPGIRAVRLNHLLWLHRQSEQYGAIAQTGWRVGYGVWRIVRVALNPLQALGQEASGMMVERSLDVLSYRLRSYATRLLILEPGRAAIELYSGRLTLSEEEIRAAQQSDLAAGCHPTNRSRSAWCPNRRRDHRRRRPPLRIVVDRRRDALNGLLRPVDRGLIGRAVVVLDPPHRRLVAPADPMLAQLSLLAPSGDDFGGVKA